jgi:hypothetical protein
MGLKKIRSEGGSGGKRGHSNMEHWAYTSEVKDAAAFEGASMTSGWSASIALVRGVAGRTIG